MEVAGGESEDSEETGGGDVMRNQRTTEVFFHNTHTPKHQAGNTTQKPLL